MTKLTMGSLFDGSGGFPFGALLNGITPIWASEIEPFPIRVTTKRLPFMKHYGDIRKMDGAKIEPVDIITFGSPCTNLSVAGRREGLSGEQSVLFYKAIRIIKEMRCATDGQSPRWICWENVPGCYSSSGGRDFQQVLTEIAKIKDETAVIPMPENGKWLCAGEIRGCASALGDGFSIAWRTLDAQFWGVAQRRRRCYLVADFAGECAGKILFEFESLSGYSPQGFDPGQGTAIGIEGRAGGAGCQPGVSCPVLNDQGGAKMSVTENMAGTLRAEEHGHQPCVVQASGFCTEHSAQSRGVGYESERSPTLRSGVVPGVVTYDARGNGNGKTVSTITGDHNGHISDYTSLVLGAIKAPENNNDQAACVPVLNARSRNLESDDNKAYALTGTDYKGTQCVCDPSASQAYGIGSAHSEGMLSDNPHSGFYKAETSRTLDKSGGNPACNQGGIAIVDPVHVQKREDDTPPVDVTAFTQNQRNEVRDLQGRAGALAAEPGAKQQTYILQSEEETALACDCRNHNTAPVSGTLQAKNNGGQSLNYINPVLETRPRCVVRRLTPQECALLQGFPVDWCADLGTPKPSEEDIAWWLEVFETHRKAVGTSSKSKSRAQIVKWLNDPHSDSAEYKMWGNGVALPCVCFVMAGIAWAAAL